MSTNGGVECSNAYITEGVKLSPISSEKAENTQNNDGVTLLQPSWFPREELKEAVNGSTQANPLKGPSPTDQPPPPQVLSPAQPQSRNAPASLSESVRRLHERFRNTSWLEMICIFVIITVVIVGHFIEIISIKYWHSKFPNGKTPGTLATLVLPSILLAAFMVTVMLLFIFFTTPSLRFAFCCQSLVMLFRIGCIDAIQSGVGVYSVIKTPNALAALVKPAAPLFATLFTKMFLKDKRSYGSPWLLISLAFVIAGILVASIFDLKHGFNKIGKNSWWASIYLVAVALSSLVNAMQAVYMLKFTYDPKFDELYKIRARGGTAVPSMGSQSTLLSAQNVLALGVGNGNHQLAVEMGNIPAAQEPEDVARTALKRLRQGRGTSVKIVMLTIMLLFRFAGTLAFLPLDGVKPWGESNSIGDAWNNLIAGGRCVATCDNNLPPFVMYTSGVLLSYVGSAYLNQYSVTMCSIIKQIAWPLAALILVFVPRWSIDPVVTPWYFSLVSIFILLLAVLLYMFWECSTGDEKDKNERQLKERMMYHLAK
ncbi:uncharacterized protein TEOVI_000548700 [Trypanosoma equiperdum]|uniref:Uncharacterized protein n=2 Tax=Trypanozoon TaxID=39700 RepID=Q38BN9_TRYB2|nr:hypothetical protein, conserved [Trypanosoma brucei brucei TREU927]EAN77781.1 hypothetical protein, conserved [Trypanosoma brucei brucei TREU927]SCU64557.1 hypothetical protein, conserved [Trypanosoma equiperdum]